MWDKYIPDSNYTWSHLAVRAEASGVALSARSSGIQQINVSGLLSLSNKIAESVVSDIEEAMRPQEKLRNRLRRRYLIERAENTIIKTLIKDWGTKSYEFRLQTEDENLFRAHSYFGLKPHGNTQDCFPHFKAYRESGGAYKAIEFLLNEMEDL
ncbi:MAG: hypothetical protein KQI78_08010 [Deltaproteobacteria bacterium]|nr:hypothetical protein [Deltaproteobacteria bacterium]